MRRHARRAGSGQLSAQQLATRPGKRRHKTAVRRALCYWTAAPAAPTCPAFCRQLMSVV